VDVFLKKISVASICLLSISLQTRYYVPNVNNLNLAWVRFTIAQCNFHTLIARRLFEDVQFKSQIGLTCGITTFKGNQGMIIDLH
jgi:hypothetical protein